jgi:uncharacterized repeat protein (TIGR02543 family)
MPDGPDVTAPAKADRTFSGYYSEVNGGGKQYYTAAMEQARNWDSATQTTLYAYWTAATYTVTFHKDPGMLWEGDHTIKVVDGNTVDTLPYPLMLGFTVKGWLFNSQDVRHGKPFTTSTPVTGDITLMADLKAIWTFTVEFDSNGGDTEAEPKTQQVSWEGWEGSTCPLPVPPAKKGYTFNGWNTKADGTGTDLTASTLLFWHTANVRVYARWSSPKVWISGTSRVGETLTCHVDANALGEPLTYQWMRSITEDGSYTDIAGQNTDTYNLISFVTDDTHLSDDAHKFLRVAVTSNEETIVSAAYGPMMR